MESNVISVVEDYPLSASVSLEVKYMGHAP